MQQMGRRGQGERANALVSSDALPALWGKRRVGAVLSGRSFPANKVVPQKMSFLSLFPSGNKDFLLSSKGGDHMLHKLPGKRWRF